MIFCKYARHLRGTYLFSGLSRQGYEHDVMKFKIALLPDDLAGLARSSHVLEFKKTTRRSITRLVIKSLSAKFGAIECQSAI